MINKDATKVSTESGKWPDVACVFLITLLLYCIGNSRISLWDRDEPRFAQPAVEMLRSGDWIVPRFNGEPFFHKPPLCYWLIAAGYKVFGVNEFATRLPSSLAGALTCVLVYLMGRRLWDRPTALLAAAVLASSLIVVTMSKLATADAVLLLITTVAIWGLVEVWQANGRARMAKSAFWVALGIAGLCKGPAILIVVAPLAVGLLIFERQRAWFRQLGWWWGLPLALLIALPWYVLADRAAQGALVQRFVCYDILARIRRPLESHRGFPGFYLAALLVDSWPFSAFLPLLIFMAFKSARTDRRLKFMLIWLFAPIVALEFVSTKMIHYLTPVMPAMALLVARTIVASPDLKRQEAWIRAGAWIHSGVNLLLATLVIAAWYWLGKTGPMAPPIMVLAGALVVTGYLPKRFWQSGRVKAAAGCHVAGMAGVVVLLSAWVLPQLESYRLSRRIADAVQARLSPDARAVLIGWNEPSTIFYLNQRKPVLLGKSQADFLEYRQAAFPAVIAVQRKRVKALIDTGRFPIDEAEEITGFDYTRGRRVTLYVLTNQAYRTAHPADGRQSPSDR